MSYVTVPRDAETLVNVVGLLVRARPEDRLRLAHDWREDAIRAGEGLNLPEPAVLVWLAGYLDGMLDPEESRVPPAARFTGDDRAQPAVRRSSDATVGAA